uniref:t-SNARE coiled-coil homology domain-containing protein n=1 Tax=Glossina brevipalpis TaxID=37001 RepID=A0A1A9W7L5_9MUSC
MALVDVDSWVTEYDSCSRLSRTLFYKLNQRDNYQNPSLEYNSLTSSIKVGLKQFDNELQQLKSKLNEATKERSVPFEEIGRRQRQIDILQFQRQKIQKEYIYNHPAEVQSETLAASSTGIRSSDRTIHINRNDVENDGEATATIDTNDAEQLKQHQIAILEQQNTDLDILSQTISRQRALATQFGQEVEDQNEILDNLAVTMERVETGVGHETHNIGLVNRGDNKTWGYWLIIIALFIAIVIVVLI